MLFVVKKTKLQRIISIVREDRTPQSQAGGGPYLRIEAAEDKITVDGQNVSGKFPCTVYEPGVLFIQTTSFRRVLRATKIEGDFLTFQINDEGLKFADVRYAFGRLNMVLYPNPAEAPPSWPPPPPESERILQEGPKPKYKPGKALYRHKPTGHIFAIENDEYGNIVSTAGPLLFKNLDPEKLTYDNDSKKQAESTIKDFDRIDKKQYEELLHKHGFSKQQMQKYLF